jgi:hypothetical protein
MFLTSPGTINGLAGPSVTESRFAPVGGILGVPTKAGAGKTSFKGTKSSAIKSLAQRALISELNKKACLSHIRAIPFDRTNNFLLRIGPRDNLSQAHAVTSLFGWQFWEKAALPELSGHPLCSMTFPAASLMLKRDAAFFP